MARNTTTKVSIKGDDQTKKAFDSATNNLTTFKKAAGALQGVLGPLSVAAAGFKMVSMGREVLDAADQVQKMSSRLKVSTEALSQYRFVADRSGTSFDMLAKSIQMSQKAISDASDGSSTAARAFDNLGLTVDTLQKMKPEDAFESIGDALSKIEDPARRTQIAMAVMGESGAAMLQVFDQGAGSVRELRKEADRLGVTLSQSAADKAAAAKDAMTDLDTAMKGLVQTIMLDGGLADGLATAVGLLSELVLALNAPLQGSDATVLGFLKSPLSILRQPGLHPDDVARYRELYGSPEARNEAYLAGGDPNAPVPYVRMPFQNDSPYRGIGNRVLPKILSPAAESDLDRLAVFLDDYRDFTVEDSIDVNGLMGGTFMPNLDAAANMATARANEIRKIQEENHTAYMAELEEQAALAEQKAKRMSDAIEGGVRGFGYALTDAVTAATDAIEAMEGAALRAAQNIIDAWIQAGIDDIIAEFSAKPDTTPRGSTSGPSGSLGNPNTKAFGAAKVGGPITVNFNISALDGPSAVAAIQAKEREIVGLVQKAYNRRGQRGPLG